MKSAWPLVSLNELLTSVNRPVPVKTEEQYRQIGIRSHGKGVFHKAPVSGMELGNKKVFWVKPGDFVLNIVLAWEGAVALLTDGEDRMIASHRFPCFRANDSRLDMSFLSWFFRTPRGVDMLGSVSPGGAGRNRTLSKNGFLTLKIPLPPLAEQRRIVARIEALAGKIEEARNLRREAEQAAAALMGCCIRRYSESTGLLGRLGDVLLSKPRNGWSARCDNTDGGIAVLSLGAVTGFHYRSTRLRGRHWKRLQARITGFGRATF